MADENYSYETWETGKDSTVTTEVTILSGQNITARTPLGQVTASGKIVAWDPAAVDGSEVAVYLAAYDVDASAADKQAQVIKAGTFNTDLVNWPASTAAEKLLAFAGTPISLQAARAIV